MWRQDWDYKCIPCISRYFPAARRAGNHFLLCVFQTNKEGGRSHEILSAAAVVQGRRMLTRLIINSGFGNTTPTESCCFTDAAWLENGAGYLAPLETLPRPPQGRALPLGGVQIYECGCYILLPWWAIAHPPGLSQHRRSSAHAAREQQAQILPEAKKKQFSKEENDPLFHLPLGLLTTSLNHLQKPGSQGQKYQYNLSPWNVKAIFPSVRGKEHSSHCESWW